MIHNGIKIEIVCGDAISFKCDVLILKHAQSLYGLDRKIVEVSRTAGIDISNKLPTPGKYAIFDAPDNIGAGKVMFVGTPRLRDFQYKDIRSFARDALCYLTDSGVKATVVSVTMHGAGYGLDEEEAFSSQLAGIVDAITSGVAPPALDKITFLEFNKRRAGMIRHILNQTIPDGIIKRDSKTFFKGVTESSERALREVGYTSDSKEHVFVAMPFKDDMEDVWDYGIKPVVKEAGYVCERADLSSYTGDVMEWVRKRIKSAEIVVADLTTSNPNVYLKVGYAWGVGVPTILISKNADDLKFDVRGQRCLIYDRIKDLEKKLKTELDNLRTSPKRS